MSCFYPFIEVAIEPYVYHHPKGMGRFIYRRYRLHSIKGNSAIYISDREWWG